MFLPTTVARLLTLPLLVRMAVACDTDSHQCFAASSEAQKVEGVMHEDPNDPDTTIYMQSRVGLDLATEKQEQRPSEVAEVAPPVYPTASAVPSRVERVEMAVQPVVQLWVRSAEENMSVLAVIAIILAVWKVARVRQRKATVKTSVTLDPSAKLQQLLRALRFEPESTDEIKLLPTDSVKASNYYKRGVQDPSPATQPQATDDSGNNTEEEPEAEAAVDAATNVVLAFAQHVQKFARESYQQLESSARESYQQLETSARESYQQLAPEVEKICGNQTILSTESRPTEIVPGVEWELKEPVEHELNEVNSGP